MKVGYLKEPFGSIKTNDEVYEWLGGGDEMFDRLAIPVTLKPSQPPYFLVPVQLVRWAGECEHFDVLKAKIQAHWRSRGSGST